MPQYHLAIIKIQIAICVQPQSVITVSRNITLISGQKKNVYS